MPRSRSPIRLAAFVVLALAAACGRPLTDHEAAFAKAIHGDTLDQSRVKILENGIVGVTSATYAVRPRTTCRELIGPPSTEPTYRARAAGVVLWNTVNIRPDWYLEDYTRQQNGELSLVAAMFFAHEITHIWQWQNRDITGYSPFKAASEHGFGRDPYLFDTQNGRPFLQYAYEQQASIVEEYVCCAVLDPGGTRTRRLQDLISEAMPLSALPIAGRDIRIPWADAEIDGICSQGT